jgi:hypothetical protein
MLRNHVDLEISVEVVNRVMNHNYERELSKQFLDPSVRNVAVYAPAALVDDIHGHLRC